MQIRVITLRHQEGLQGFPEDALRAATFGKTVLGVSEHFSQRRVRLILTFNMR